MSIGKMTWKLFPSPPKLLMLDLHLIKTPTGFQSWQPTSHPWSWTSVQPGLTRQSRMTRFSRYFATLHYPLSFFIWCFWKDPRECKQIWNELLNTTVAHLETTFGDVSGPSIELFQEFFILISLQMRKVWHQGSRSYFWETGHERYRLLKVFKHTINVRKN